MRAGSLALLIVVAGSGCVSVVYPPEAPEDPCEIYLLTSGRHGGLVLPDEQGGYVEFGYGEWGWYALNNNAWYDVFDTILWPTQGALGMRRIPADSEAGLRSHFPGCELAGITVARAKAEQLRRELEEQILAGKEKGTYNPLFDMRFVPHESGFWMFHTCHDQIADWLRRLGCRVSRTVISLEMSVAVPD